jgi:HSP20 family protein
MLQPIYPFENMLPTAMKGMIPQLFWDETRTPMIRLDVEENEKVYTVKADLPGVKKEDIFVDVDGDEITIRAEVRRELPETKEANKVHSERFYGMLSRTFTLPMEVNAETTEARYENGVLWLTLPKKAGGATHRVAVS